MTRTTLRRACRALALSLLVGLAVPSAARALNVYAAASLREVFEQIDSAPTYTFLGSNQLQRQIENGGPADVFASAAPQEAQAGARGLGASSTRGSRASRSCSPSRRTAPRSRKRDRGSSSRATARAAAV